MERHSLNSYDIQPLSILHGVTREEKKERQGEDFVGSNERLLDRYRRVVNMHGTLRFATL
jgi:hypothetical protein